MNCSDSWLVICVTLLLCLLRAGLMRAAAMLCAPVTATCSQVPRDLNILQNFAPLLVCCDTSSKFAPWTDVLCGLGQKPLALHVGTLWRVPWRPTLKSASSDSADLPGPQTLVCALCAARTSRLSMSPRGWLTLTDALMERRRSRCRSQLFQPPLEMEPLLLSF